MQKEVLFQDLGIQNSYKEIWDYQETLLKENVQKKADEATRLQPSTIYCLWSIVPFTHWARVAMKKMY
jgi:hypothetical protein